MSTLHGHQLHLLAAIAGVASHVFYFRIGEHHLYAWTYIFVFLGTCLAAAAGSSSQGRLPIFAAAQLVVALAGSWLVGVYSSLVVYRTLLHPLNQFPGPWQARFGKLWFMIQVQNCDAHLKLHALHQRYGPIVRVGSNDLSIIDPEFTLPSFAAGSEVIKNEFYDTFKPNDSMHSVRDKRTHDRRRRVWAPAFSDRAVRGYEVFIRHFNKALLRRLEEHEGSAVNVTQLFGLYSFDVMGRLVFGKEYKTLESGQPHWSAELLARSSGPIAIRTPTWLVRLLLSIPGLTADFHRYLAFCVGELRTRLAQGNPPEGKDIIGSLLAVYNEDPDAWKDPFLQGDSRLIAIAGSDTTASALTFLFYYLAKDPTLVETLRSELRPLMQGEWGDKDLQNAPLLNGAINEALRLHPPVPSGVTRITPRHGLRVGETFIPGGVNFFMPLYVMGRDDNSYPEATRFLPSRWTSPLRTTYLLKPDAFAPFSLGPYGCIGRNIALTELRTLTASIIRAYTPVLAPGEDGVSLLTQTKDCVLNQVVPKCEIVFKRVHD